MIGERHNWANMTMAVYAGLIRERIHFAQASYRDGEWYCMLGHSGGNCNGEAYDPALGGMLRNTLLHPVGQLCVFWWPGETKGLAARAGALKWIAQHKPPVTWIPDRPFGRANEIGELAPFFAAARTRNVTIVGPQHMERFPTNLLGDFQHIVVRDGTAWQSADDTVAQVEDMAREDELVLFAAGMASCVMIHRLWGGALRHKATLIDIGAVLDPYAGVYSRGEYVTEAWQTDTQPRNIP